VQEHLIADESLDLTGKQAIAQTLGFDGLELRDARPARRPALASARAAGVVMPTVCPEAHHFLADFEPVRRRSALDGLLLQLSGIATVGGHGVITPAAWGMFSTRLPRYGNAPRSSDEDRQVLLESLAELGEHAEREGVLVLIEPLNRYEDHMLNRVAQAAEVCLELGLPSVRILADTYHMNIEEDDLPTALASIAPLLGAVHLSDSNRHQPGAGHVDFREVIGTLRSIGFSGVLGVECRLRGGSDGLRETGALLRGLMDAEPW
jgi:sugar phosphate isomerase/epimerase